MDNTTRSERTRNAAIQAALTIIGRDGPGRLTLDAIARESGMSKGALMHQFRTKEAVLKALLEYQTAHFAAFSRRYLAEHAGGRAHPRLAAEIATLREALTQSQHIAIGILGAVADEPGLLSLAREGEATMVKALKAEAEDPELSLLRWAAARGLALSALFGLSSLVPEERERLFDRLLDDSQWSALAKPAPSRAGTPRKTEGR